VHAWTANTEKILGSRVALSPKPVFHFNRIVTYRSIFFCVKVISSTLVVRKQRNTLRFATIRLKWKTSFKAVFHFNRIVPKRSVFLCFLSGSVELMTSTQKKMLRYVTIRLKWKTGFSLDLVQFLFAIRQW
jgi:hypothetical protein